MRKKTKLFAIQKLILSPSSSSSVHGEMKKKLDKRLNQVIDKFLEQQKKNFQVLFFWPFLIENKLIVTIIRVEKWKYWNILSHTHNDNDSDRNDKKNMKRKRKNENLSINTITANFKIFLTSKSIFVVVVVVYKI